MKELNKAAQDLKVEVETIKKTQMELNLVMENLGTRSGITPNSIEEIEKKISGVENTLEGLTQLSKKIQNEKQNKPKQIKTKQNKKLPTQSIQEM